MATFIDRFFRIYTEQLGGFKVPLSGIGQEHVTKGQHDLGEIGYSKYYASILKGAQAFDGTSVSDYMFFGTDREHWDVEKGDFPGLIPPFKQMVFDFRRPKRITSPDLADGITPEDAASAMPYNWSVVVDGKTVDEAEDMWVNHHHPDLGSAYTAQELQDAFQELVSIPANRNRIKFICTATLFMDPYRWEFTEMLGMKCKEGDIFGPLTSLMWACDKEGEIVGKPIFSMRMGTVRSVYQWLCAKYPDRVGELRGEFIKEMTENIFGPSFLNPALMAISMLNCSNVEVIEHKPNPKHNARRVARGELELVSYHTLHIQPMKKQTKVEASEPTGAHNAQHLRRGGFKDYRRGKGLFGKLKGLWWFSETEVGSAEHGTVVKDYVVDAE